MKTGDVLLPFTLVCGRMGISPRTGYNQLSDKRFPLKVVKINHRSYVLQSELDSYLSGLAGAGPAEKPRRGRRRSHQSI